MYRVSTKLVPKIFLILEYLKSSNMDSDLEDLAIVGAILDERRRNSERSRRIRKKKRSWVRPVYAVRG